MMETIRTLCDPTRPGVQQGLSGRITVRRVDDGATKKIEDFLQQTGSEFPDYGEEVTYNAFNLPWGTYTLTKVD